MILPLCTVKLRNPGWSFNVHKGKAMTLKAMLNAQEKGFNKYVLNAINDANISIRNLDLKILKSRKFIVTCKIT